MNCSNELRQIANHIVKIEAGGLKNSQYWGLRLRLIAAVIDGDDAPLTSHSSRAAKAREFCKDCREEFGHMDNCKGCPYYPPPA